MIGHGVGIAAVSAVIVLISLLPFLPGPYDSLAAPLSAMARVFGFRWPAARPVWSRPARPAQADGRRRFADRIVYRVGHRLSRGFEYKRIRARHRDARSGHLWAGRAEFAAEDAGAGAGFVSDRCAAGGEYPPVGLCRARRRIQPESVWKDYSPAVIGIERFHYEASGDAYNVVFEQIARELSTREFVVYNPRDEQAVTSHTMALLQTAPEHLGRRRGYFAVHPTTHPHWKYFWFD